MNKHLTNRLNNKIEDREKTYPMTETRMVFLLYQLMCHQHKNETAE